MPRTPSVCTGTVAPLVNDTTPLDVKPDRCNGSGIAYPCCVKTRPSPSRIASPAAIPPATQPTTEADRLPTPFRYGRTATTYVSPESAAPMTGMSTPRPIDVQT